ncbi:MAG: cytochrome c maturation protein CcmE domain-containing protein [Acidimicrobiia bacterium]
MDLTRPGRAGVDDDLGDDDGIDVTPRTIDEGPPGARERRRPAVYALLALLVVAVAFVGLQFLGSAVVYYKNADEAVRDKASLGTDRFRAQGVVQAPVASQGGAVTFAIEFNEVSVPVRHVGDPPDLFEPGIPVVIEGHWSEDGSVFESDNMQIKHSSEYKAENSDRVSPAGP